ncbi:MAG: trehalose-phosphatase [Myxococcota bacterium]
MSALADRIQALAAPRLLALDVDGTLAPIVDDPWAARVPPATLEAVCTLAGREGWVVALLSGRDAEGLDRVAPLTGVWRGAEHGRVIMAPGEGARPETLTDEEREALEELEAMATAEWVPKGARLERKPAARAVHVRGLDPALGEPMLDAAEALALSLGLHPRRGRAVLEAEARRGSKRAGLARLAQRTRAASLIFAGDDLTDFEAIELASAHGVGIFVRSPERPEGPAASAVVAGTEGMASLLLELAGA